MVGPGLVSDKRCGVESAGDRAGPVPARSCGAKTQANGVALLYAGGNAARPRRPCLCDAVAQLAVQLSHKEQVAGSKPASATTCLSSVDGGTVLSYSTRIGSKPVRGSSRGL